MAGHPTPREPSRAAFRLTAGLPARSAGDGAFRLLATLLAGAGSLVTHRQLLREVWGPSHVEHTHYLRVHMGHLRQKLEADPARPQHMLTDTGLGYRFMPGD